MICNKKFKRSSYTFPYKDYSIMFTRPIHCLLRDAETNEQRQESGVAARYEYRDEIHYLIRTSYELNTER